MLSSYNLFTSQRGTSESKQFSQEEIPYIPPNISLEHVSDQGLLLDAKTTASVDKALKTAKDGRYSKSTGHSPYGIMRTHDKNYAIYLGARHPGKALGAGGFGKVKLAQSGDGHWFALKVQKDDLASERKILSIMRQSKGNVVSRQKPDKPLKYSMLMKYVRGSNLQTIIDQHMADKIKIHPLRWIDILIKLFKQVKLLQKRSILHGDLKLENIIYDNVSNKVYIVDYGFSSITEKDGTVLSADLGGTAEYIAPELIAMDKQYGYSTYSSKTEMYALGRITKKILGILDTREETDSINEQIKTLKDIWNPLEKSEKKRRKKV